MTTTRLLTWPTRLATCTVLLATALLVPLCGAAEAAGSPVASIPAPGGCAPVEVETPGVDDLVAQRKAAWAADRVARGLF